MLSQYAIGSYVAFTRIYPDEYNRLEYEMALYLASGFDYREEVGRISFMIIDLDKKIKELELEYALNIGEKSEKKKDYIKAINYYQQGLKILNDAQNLDENESRIKKLKKKIANLQKNL